MSGSHGTSSHTLYPQWMNEKSSGENHMDLTSGRMNGLCRVGMEWMECELQIAKLQAWKIDMYAGMCTYYCHFCMSIATNTYASFSFSGMQKWKIQFCVKKRKLLCMQIFLGAANLNFCSVSGLNEGRMNGREMKRAENWERNWDGLRSWIELGCYVTGLCSICYYGFEMYEIWC